MPISQTDLSWRRPTDHLDPLEQVQDMISKYESTKEPSHALRYITGSSKFYILFCELIEHHLGMIMSRSPAIEDGHVTVYDKCLLELCRHGHEIHRLAAQEFYIREFMGIDPDHPLQNVEEILDREVLARGVLLRCSRPALRSQPRHDSVDKEAKIEHYPATPSESQSPPFSETGFKTYGTRFAKNPTINTNIKRMLDIYFKARNDFYSVESSENYQKSVDAAKFLRDSAQNVLDYLRVQDLLPSCRDELVVELQTVFQYAKSKTIEFLGGKKRRFEIEKDYKRAASPPSRDAVAESNYVKSESPRRHRYRRVDRYEGAASHRQRLWHPYAGYEGSRSRHSRGSRESI